MFKTWAFWSDDRPQNKMQLSMFSMSVICHDMCFAVLVMSVSVILHVCDGYLKFTRDQEGNTMCSEEPFASDEDRNKNRNMQA